MSKELALLQFIENSDGLICEDFSDEIESTGISTELLDELIEKFGLDTQEISEEYGTAEKSTYSFIPNDKIDDIIEFLEDRYIAEIKSTVHQLGMTDNSQGQADAESCDSGLRPGPAWHSRISPPPGKLKWIYSSPRCPFSVHW